MIFCHPIALMRQLCPPAIWRVDGADASVFITFDDGPIPEVTPWVLDVLDHYGVKATFFVVGDNVRKHPDIYADVVARGHAVGNHTYHHLQGRKCSVQTYVDDVVLAQQLLQSETTARRLFRPPHGLLRRRQWRELDKQGYHMVQWDVVTRDYVSRATPARIARTIRRYARGGSIITFHDSLRSAETLRVALPQTIEWLQQQGYTFRTLADIYGTSH